mgnify:CR=1 FL=1
MYENIFGFMSSQSTQNGLLLVDPSTGCGKTFQSCQAIYDYVHGENAAKKVYLLRAIDSPANAALKFASVFVPLRFIVFSPF